MQCQKLLVLLVHNNFAKPCHDSIVAQTYFKHDQLSCYVNKLRAQKTRNIFIAAALKIYAEMIYTNQSGKRKLNHDMTPKERAIHFLKYSFLWYGITYKWCR